jgi:hypothetical protein
MPDGDPARRHGVDAHAAGGPLEGGGLGQVGHAGARGAGVAHAGHAVPHVGRHVDDGAAVGLHGLQVELAHHQEAAGQVVAMTVSKPFLLIAISGAGTARRRC